MMELRRAGIAIAIGAVLSSLGVAATGALAVEGEAPPDVLFLLPDVHPGDSGTYRSGPDQLHFWFTAEPWIAANGAMTSALVLHQDPGMDRYESVQPGPFPLALWLVHGEVVAWTTLVASGSGGIAAGNINDPAVELWGAYDTYETHYDGAASPFCGLIHSAQGKQVSRQTIVTALGCPAPMAFAGRAVAPAASNASSNVAAFVAPGVRLSLDPQFPVPASVTVEGRVWRLDAFNRTGLGPLVPVTGPTQEVAYTESAIPDEAGINHPFPLSQALADALADPVPNPLQEFLGAHGSSYIAEAGFVEIIQDGRREQRWNVTAADGSDAVAVTLSRAGAQVDESPRPDPLLPVFPAAPRTLVQEATPADRAYPRAAQGVRLATLSSLADRWEVIASNASREDGVSAWGFSVLCGETCDSATSQTWIGINTEREFHGPTGPLRSFEWLFLEETLTVDDAGRSVMLTYTDWYLNENAGPVVIQEDSLQPAGPASARATASPAPSWTFPSATATASLTLLGLLAGLAYYLWPTLKAGAFGLLRSAAVPPENAIRLEVRQAIEASPGIHFHALRRTTGKAAGTLRHHLRVLEEQGDIIAHDQGGYKCYFIARGTSRHLIAGAGALKAPSARRMLHGIVQAGHLSMGDAAVFAGLTPSTATHHALRLEEAGLVTRTRAGRSIELRPTAAATLALDAAGAA